MELLGGRYGAVGGAEGQAEGLAHVAELLGKVGQADVPAGQLHQAGGAVPGELRLGGPPPIKQHRLMVPMCLSDTQPDNPIKQLNRMSSLLLTTARRSVARPLPGLAGICANA